MSEATLCPLLFLFDPSMKPGTINNNQIKCIKEHYEHCNTNNINIKMSAHILKHILDSYPWNQINNPIWKQYLFLWQASVVSPLTNKVDIVGHTIDGSDNDIYALWYHWLLHWKDGLSIKGVHPKGIGSTQGCKSDIQSFASACRWYIIAASSEDWKLVKHPWLLKYHPQLPISGEYPFTPPEGWETEAPVRRGSQNGFLDNSGDEWVWCLKHRDHWDVQLARSDNYRRVTPDGNLL